MVVWGTTHLRLCLHKTYVRDPTRQARFEVPIRTFRSNGVAIRSLQPPSHLQPVQDELVAAARHFDLAADIIESALEKQSQACLDEPPRNLTQAGTQQAARQH